MSTFTPLLALLLAPALGAGQNEDIAVMSATMWSKKPRGEKAWAFRHVGLQESSQPRIRRQAAAAAKKWIAGPWDDQFSIEVVFNEPKGMSVVVVSHTSWSGDLSFREPNTVGYGPDILWEGLLKIKQDEIELVPIWLRKSFLRCEATARDAGRGMWSTRQQ